MKRFVGLNFIDGEWKASFADTVYFFQLPVYLTMLEIEAEIIKGATGRVSKDQASEYVDGRVALELLEKAVGKPATWEVVFMRTTYINNHCKAEFRNGLGSVFSSTKSEVQKYMHEAHGKTGEQYSKGYQAIIKSQNERLRPSEEINNKGGKEVSKGKITKEQRLKAIDESIEHWVGDALIPLIKDSSFTHGMSGANCPLCFLFLGERDKCSKCPLKSCSEGSAYDNFLTAPSSQTALNVITSLKEAREKVEKEEEVVDVKRGTYFREVGDTRIVLDKGDIAKALKNCSDESIIYVNIDTCKGTVSSRPRHIVENRIIKNPKITVGEGE